MSGDESPTLKRKRDTKDEAELEIDLALPEPLSRKALRRAKKGKSAQGETTSDFEDGASVASDTEKKKPSHQEHKKAARSNYGIWIGNLPWSVSKQDLRDFMCKAESITDANITRVHMPTPSNKGAEAPAHSKPKNKGFAYIDFETEAQLTEALALSEQLLLGRRVLIKNATSFEGRPDKVATSDVKTVDGKPPSKRIFIGNLGFDVTQEDLITHFTQCGEIADVHMATFEDSGKCKGFAWVTFSEEEDAKKAVLGYVMKDDEDGKKGRKWWVNKIQGRVIRSEFAEDKAVRYQKRFSKPRVQRDGEEQQHQAQQQAIEEIDVKETKNEQGSTAHDRRRAKRTAERGNHSDRPRWKKPDVHPSMEARPPKGTGAIVESQATKITFD